MSVDELTDFYRITIKKKVIIHSIYFVKFWKPNVSIPIQTSLKNVGIYKNIIIFILPKTRCSLRSGIEE